MFRNFNRLFGFDLLYHSALGGLFIPIPQISMDREGNSVLSEEHKGDGINTPLPFPAQLSPTHSEDKRFLCLVRSESQSLLSVLSIENVHFLIHVFIFRN